MLQVQKCREQHKMTQQQVANNLGVTRQLISAIETGTASPSLETLIKLSTMFGCTIDDLVHDEPTGRTSTPDNTTERR